jgi:hypothetical protein
MSADVAVPIPATPGAASRAVDGPRWVPSARELETEQTDGRGVRWWVESVEVGGRVLHWRGPLGREARTEATPAMPGYPSDAAVIEAERERRQQYKARRRTA